MDLLILKVELWMLGIRTHAPQSGGYHPAPAHEPPSIPLLVGGFVAGLLMIALALWLVVWLAIQMP